MKLKNKTRILDDSDEFEYLETIPSTPIIPSNQSITSNKSIHSNPFKKHVNIPNPNQMQQMQTQLPQINTPVQDQGWQNIKNMASMSSSSVLKKIQSSSNNYQNQKEAFQELIGSENTELFMNRYMKQLSEKLECIIQQSLNKDILKENFNNSKQRFFNIVEKTLKNEKYIRPILLESKLPNDLKDSAQLVWEAKNQERKNDLNLNANDYLSDKKIYKEFLKFLAVDNYSVRLEDLIEYNNNSFYEKNPNNSLNTVLDKKLKQLSFFENQSSQNSNKSFNLETPITNKFDTFKQSITLAVNNLKESYEQYQNELKIDNSYLERLQLLQNWLSCAEILDTKLSVLKMNINDFVKQQVEVIINSYKQYKSGEILTNLNPVYQHYINRINEINKEIDSIKAWSPLLLAFYNCNFSLIKEGEISNKIKNVIQQLKEAQSSFIQMDGINLKESPFLRFKQESEMQLFENELNQNVELIKFLKEGELDKADLLIFITEIYNKALTNLKQFYYKVKEQNDKEVELKEILNLYKFDSTIDIQFVKSLPKNIGKQNQVFFQLDKNLYPVKILFSTNSQQGKIEQNIGKEPTTKKLISLLLEADFKQKAEMVAYFLIYRNREGSFVDFKQFTMTLSDKTQYFKTNASDFKKLQSQQNSEEKVQYMTLEEAKQNKTEPIIIVKQDGTHFIKQIVVQLEKRRKTFFFFPGFNYSLSENEYSIGQSSIIDEILFNKYYHDTPLTRLSATALVEQIKESIPFDQCLFKEWISNLSKKQEALKK